jgi:DNA-binding XRE family transcriptional regulator
MAMTNKGAYCPECGRFEKGNIDPDRFVRCGLCVQKRLAKIDREGIEKLRAIDAPVIKQIREEKGYDQITFAKEIKMSRSHLQRIENGSLPLTQKWREAIIERFPDLAA